MSLPHPNATSRAVMHAIEILIVVSTQTSCPLRAEEFIGLFRESPQELQQLTYRVAEEALIKYPFLEKYLIENLKASFEDGAWFETPFPYPTMLKKEFFAGLIIFALDEEKKRTVQ